jgi:hypothetical protein
MSRLTGYSEKKPGGVDHFNHPKTVNKNSILRSTIHGDPEKKEGLNFYLNPYYTQKKQHLFEVRVQDKRGLSPWRADQIKFNVLMDIEDMKILSKFFADAAKTAAKYQKDMGLK